LFVTFTT